MAPGTAKIFAIDLLLPYVSMDKQCCGSAAFSATYFLIIMATKIPLRHKETGIVKNGFYGFSWTTLFFGFFPALFRGDFMTFIGGFVVSLIIGVITFGLGMLFISFVWAFMYNKYYTRKMIEKGYTLAGSEGDNALAASALGIAMPAASTI